MFVGLMIIAIGTLLLLEKMGVIQNWLGTYWPVLIIIVGISMLFRNGKGPRRGNISR